MRAPGEVEMMPIIAGSDMIGILPKSTIESFSDRYAIKALPLPFGEDVYDLCAIWHA